MRVAGKTEQVAPAAPTIGSGDEALGIFATCAPVGIIVVQRSGHLVYANPRWLALSGLTREQARGWAWLRVVHPADRRGVMAVARQVVAGERQPVVTCRLGRPGRDVRWIRAEGTTLRNVDGHLTGYAIWVSDITSARAARAEVDRLSLVLERSSDFVTIIDLSGRLLYANETVRRFFGVDTGADLRGRSLDFGFSEESNRRLVEEAYPALHCTGSWEGELVLVATDGSEVTVLQSSHLHRDQDGAPAFVSGIGRDITSLKAAQSQLAASEARFRNLARHDPLTGLPNRSQVRERLQRMTLRRRRGGSTAAALFVDLDRFKDFNDSFGHDAGDRLLAALALRLREGLRPEDFIARLGGDEFVVMCEALESEDGAARVGTRILELVRRPFTIDGTEVVMSASVGIAVVDDGDATTLLRQADAAMYAAKAQGRDRVERFEVGLTDSSIDLRDDAVADASVQHPVTRS